MKHGARHWWIERLISLALIPLSVWFVIALITRLLGADPAALANWMASPLIALVMGTFAFAMFIHAKMGLQVIIDDYVHRENHRLALMIFKDTAIYALLAATLAAIIKLHFGA